MKKLLYFTFFSLFFLSVFAGKIETRWGACCHPARDFEYPLHVKMFDGAKDLGLKALRTDIDWSLVFKQDKSDFNFDHYDVVFGNARDRGINILGIMTGQHIAINQKPLWEKYIKATVSHYKGWVEDWEIINEVDWSHWLEAFDNDIPRLAKEYVTLLKLAYPAVKKANPNATVLYSGVAHMDRPFIEETFKLGAADYFDIMNVHRYYGMDNPEQNLEYAFGHLKSVMKKYNISKPIWFTETGTNTAPIQESVIKGVKLALKKLDISTDEIAEIFDEQENYSSRYFIDPVAALFPKKKSLKKIKLAQIETLNPKEIKAIILQANATFPRKYINELLNYVAEGGTIVSMGDIPLAFDCFFDENGNFKRKSQGNGIAQMFNMSVSTAWERMHSKNSKDTLPKSFNKNFKAGIGFEELNPQGVYPSYYLKDGFLKGEDKIYPIMQAVHNGKEYTLGALIRYNSTLKGNAIVFVPPINSGGSEKYAGMLLPRYMISALHFGADKIFNYSYHSNGLVPDAEGHFGITRYDCSYKPSWYAYKTIIEMLGEKSKPQLKFSNNIAYATWIRDDGKKVHAIWKMLQVKKIRANIKVDGKIEEMKNWLGKNQSIPKKSEFERNLEPAPLYIVGPKNLTITIPLDTNPKLTVGKIKDLTNIK